MSWSKLEEEDPVLAAFGVARLHGAVAYLATTRADGGPRVHPVTPIIADGHLFVFMEPTSPKGHDLQRDGRYALHCAVSDSSGDSGEFWVRGRGRLVDDPGLRALATARATYAPADRYVLYELGAEGAASTVYEAEGARRRFWPPRPASGQGARP